MRPAESKQTATKLKESDGISLTLLARSWVALVAS